jgi:hypothetical protein
MERNDNFKRNNDIVGMKQIEDVFDSRTPKSE